MDFALSPKVKELQQRVAAFMDQHVYPIEKAVDAEMNTPGKEHIEPEILKEVRRKSKAAGLWNLFIPDEEYGKGLKVAEYAPLCEIMGRSPIGAPASHCMAGPIPRKRPSRGRRRSRATARADATRGRHPCPGTSSPPAPRAATAG